MDEPLPQELASEENICIIDSGITHTGPVRLAETWLNWLKNTILAELL